MDYFLGIGAQNAGTSWLYQQLRRHPDIHLPKVKEIHYFDRIHPNHQAVDYTRWLIQWARNAIRNGKLNRADRLLEVANLPYRDNNGKAYLEYLNRNGDDNVKLVGEITPAYATLTKTGFEFVRELLDTPKIIFLMRDPLSRYWSAVRMERKKDPVRAFESYIDRPTVYDRCDYVRTIRELEKVFDTDSIHYEFYESLFNEDSLSRIAKFLGIAPQWDWNLDLIVKAGHSAQMPEPSTALLERLRPQYEFVYANFADSVPEAWQTAVPASGR